MHLPQSLLKSAAIVATMLLAPAGLLSCVAGPAQCIAAEGKPRVEELGRLELPMGFRYPNGIAARADGTLYVGSVETGTVLVRPPDADWRPLRLGRDEMVFAGTSLRLDDARGVLWGTSPDFAPSRPAGEAPRPHRVFRLDAATGRTLSSAPVPDGGFGNDLSLDSGGGAWLTDTRLPRLLHIAADGTTFRTVVEDERFEPIGGIGLSGVAVLDDERVAVVHFGSGRLFIIDAESGEITEPKLPRSLANPDGIRALPSNRLLITEGDVPDGNGRLTLAENLDGHTVRLTTLAQGLQSPVNLTLHNDRVLVSECRIRHLMNPTAAEPTPQRFWVNVYRLHLPAE